MSQRRGRLQSQVWGPHQAVPLFPVKVAHDDSWCFVAGRLGKLEGDMQSENVVKTQIGKSQKSQKYRSSKARGRQGLSSALISTGMTGPAYRRREGLGLMPGQVACVGKEATHSHGTGAGGMVGL